MSENKIYQGIFAELLRAFIEEKRSLGCRYKEEERLSFIFDQLSLNYDCSDGLTAELVNAFTEYQPNWQATTQKRRISFVQNFGAYLLRHDIHAFRAGYTVMRSMQPEFKPYIFSHTEIDQFFAMADNIRPNCRNSHIFYPVLFRILYGTGIRISEALSLTMDDIDLKEQTIRIINPKNHKDRILPISDSIAEYCRWYQGKIHPVYHKDDLFFKSNRGTGCYYRNNIQVFFSRMIADAGIPTHGFKGGGPHLHCLRHTFCVHSLEKMIREGVPHGVALQLLCSYMGHQSLSATGRYLQLTAEAFPDLMEKIEEATRDIFPVIAPLEKVRMPYEEE